jgi:hypothetical protein
MIKFNKTSPTEFVLHTDVTSFFVIKEGSRWMLFYNDKDGQEVIKKCRGMAEAKSHVTVYLRKVSKNLSKMLRQ